MSFSDEAENGAEKKKGRLGGLDAGLAGADGDELIELEVLLSDVDDATVDKRARAVSKSMFEVEIVIDDDDDEVEVVASTKKRTALRQKSDDDDDEEFEFEEELNDDDVLEDDEEEVSSSHDAKKKSQKKRSMYAEVDSDDDFGFAPAPMSQPRKSFKKTVRPLSPDRRTDAEKREMAGDGRELDTVLAWRYKAEAGENDVSGAAAAVAAKGNKRMQHFGNGVAVGGSKELFVSWKGLSHRHCEWISESKAKVLNPLKVRNFLDRKSEPMLEKDGPPFPTEWLVCTRVIDEKNGYAQCLWSGLEYERPSWEEIRPLQEADALFAKQLEMYRARRARKGKAQKKIPRPDPSKATDFKALTAEQIGLSVAPFPHQVEGISWLLYKWVQGENVILADEMGLGKTCQSIGVLNVLQRLFLRRRFLVIAPLTTLSNWVREIHRFLPSCDVFVLSGSEESRQLCFEREMADGEFDVVVSSYEVVMNNIRLFNRFQWDALILDEGHRLKSRSTLGAIRLRSLISEWIVILTGTPVQNKPEELTNLLFFLRVPGMENEEEVAKRFSMEKLQTSAGLAELHNLVRPRMLRRVKEDIDLGIPGKVEVVVPVDLAVLQKSQYKTILNQNYSMLKRLGSASTSSKPMCNIFAQLRKCVQHPYLFPDAEIRDTTMSRETEYIRLIEASGKLAMLDRMLAILKKKGHRVLIFSQYVIMLDVLEDYLNYREYTFERIDGGSPYAQRQAAIDRFNAPESDCFCFLLSTRATRLGINLATADTVIFYDADFNPQNDLQALSRAHRIGQTKVVAIYTLVARNTVEERLLEIARSKRFLEHIVVENIEEEFETATLNQMLIESSQRLFSETSSDLVYDDAALEALMDRDAHLELQKVEEAKQKSDKKDRSEIENGVDLAVDVTSNNEKAPAGTPVSSFKFARVWEVTPPPMDSGALPLSKSETASFWSSLLADERKRIEENERAEAERYGKGKRLRSQIIPTASFNDVVDGEKNSGMRDGGADASSSFEVEEVSDEGFGKKGASISAVAPLVVVETKASKAFCEWVTKRFGANDAFLAEHAYRVWSNLPDLLKERTEWQVDESATGEEPDFLKTARLLAQEQLNCEKKKKRRKTSSKKDSTVLLEGDERADVQRRLEVGEAVTADEKKRLRLALLQEWLQEHHPRLLASFGVLKLWNALDSSERMRLFGSKCEVKWKPKRPVQPFAVFRSSAKYNAKALADQKAGLVAGSKNEVLERYFREADPEVKKELEAISKESHDRFALETKRNMPFAWIELSKQIEDHDDGVADTADPVIEATNDAAPVETAPVEAAPVEVAPVVVAPAANSVDVPVRKLEGKALADVVEARFTFQKMTRMDQRALRGYSLEVRPKLIQENPQKLPAEIDAIVVQRFLQLSASELEPFLQQAKVKEAAAVAVIKPKKATVVRKLWNCDCGKTDISNTKTQCPACAKDRPGLVIVE